MTCHVSSCFSDSLIEQEAIVKSGVEQAISLVKRGYRILPLKPNSKVSLVKFDKAAKTTEQARLLFHELAPCNFGVLLEDLLVVDIDVRSNGDGHRFLPDIKKAAGDAWNEAPQIATPSKGLHAYFRISPEQQKIYRTGPRTNIFGAGSRVDVKTGARNYVVAPPSSSDEGRWQGELPAIEDVPMAPEALLRLLFGGDGSGSAATAAPPSGERTPASVVAHTGMGDHCRNVLLSAKKNGVLDVSDYEDWRDAVFALATAVARDDLDKIEAWQVLEEFSCTLPDGSSCPGYDHENNRRIFENAIERNPGIKSPITIHGIARKLKGMGIDAGPVPNGRDRTTVATNDPGTSQRPLKKLSELEFINQIFTELEFWLDESTEEAFVTLPATTGCTLHLKVDSSTFRDEVQERHGNLRGSIANDTAISKIIHELQRRTRKAGRKYPVWKRIARRYDDKGNPCCIWLDPKWEDGGFIEITKEGWRIVRDVPVKFQQSRSMHPLPEPKAAPDALKKLRQLFSVETETEFMLLVAWMLSALMPNRGPYLILFLNGEHGSGKTNATRLLKKLVDPSEPTVSSPPQSEEDIYIAANNAHVLAYDNISFIRPWLSDALARLATGGAYRTRKRYTDTEEVIMKACVPLIINGIPDLLSRPDLASRSLAIQMKAIPSHERKSEREFLREFNQAWPSIFALLLEALSEGLRNFNKVRPDNLSRMADAMHWCACCAPAFDWEPEQMISAFEEHEKWISGNLKDNEPLVSRIRDFLESSSVKKGKFKGLVSELHKCLSEGVDFSDFHSSGLPKTAQSLGNKLNRIASMLRDEGIEMNKERSRKGTVVTLEKMV